MPIVSNNPLVKDGITYPYLAVTMAVSPKYDTNYVGGSIALRFSPFAYGQNHEVLRPLDENGNPDASLDKVIAMIDVFENGTPDELQIVEAIMTQIQNLVNIKQF